MPAPVKYNYIYTCAHCGRTVDCSRFYLNRKLSKAMKADSLCFECAYWLEYLKNPTPDTYLFGNNRVMRKSPWQGYLKNHRAAIQNPIIGCIFAHGK